MFNRNRLIKIAGAGIKAVQQFIPHASSKEARLFLNAVADEIIEGRERNRNEDTILGDIVVEETPSGFYNSPYEKQSSFKGVVGVEAHYIVDLDIAQIMRVSGLSFDETVFGDIYMPQDQLTRALNLNIEARHLSRMDNVEFDEALGSPLYTIGRYLDDTPYGELLEFDVESYNFDVIELQSKREGEFSALVKTECEYSLVVSK